MKTPTFHIAQFNIARLVYPISDPENAGFVNKLDEVNALAEQTPGFVWRLQSDSGNATDIDAYNDPHMIINMSVWDSIDALFDFTYQNQHVEVFRQRRKWFERPETPHLVLWWIPAGHIPSIEEGKARLERLNEQGPTAEAFTFKTRFPPPGHAEIIQLYNQLINSWNNRNAAAYAGVFADDGSVVGFDGSQMNGRFDIEATIGAIFEDHVTAPYYTKVREVRFLSPNVAVLRAVAGMIPPGQSDINPAVNAIQSIVAFKQTDCWKIALFQNTPAQFHGRPELVEQLTEELRQLL